MYIYAYQILTSISKIDQHNHTQSYLLCLEFMPNKRRGQLSSRKKRMGAYKLLKFEIYQALFISRSEMGNCINRTNQRAVSQVEQAKVPMRRSGREDYSEKKSNYPSIEDEKGKGRNYFDVCQFMIIHTRVVYHDSYKQKRAGNWQASIYKYQTIILIKLITILKEKIFPQRKDSIQMAVDSIHVSIDLLVSKRIGSEGDDNCTLWALDLRIAVFEAKAPVFQPINFQILQMEKKQEHTKKQLPNKTDNINHKKYNIPEIVEALKRKGTIDLIQLTAIIQEAQHILKIEPTIKKITSPLVIVGDIHGQFYDLINLFEKFGYPPNTNYLFLGDYVDRGKFCIEVLVLILALKINYPTSVHLLRGNHEGRVMTTSFNFKIECEAKYQSNVYELFIDLFTTLPLCAVIDGKYFAVHGGLSPKATCLGDIEKINRFCEIPEQGALCDLLWSDPLDENHEEWKDNKNRSCSYFYSRNQSIKFLAANALRMIIRGHEVQLKGYKYQVGTNGQPLALTVFSAPRYCDTYKNKGAVAILNGKSVVIQSFKEVEHPFVLSNYNNAFQLSFPVMAAKITKILSHFLKTKQVAKSFKSIKQNPDAELQLYLSRFESMENMLVSSVNSIEALMLSSSQTANGLIDANENVSQSLLEFLEMNSAKRGAQSEIFGPKSVKFIRVMAHSIEDDPIQ